MLWEMGMGVQNVGRISRQQLSLTRKSRSSPRRKAMAFQIVGEDDTGGGGGIEDLLGEKLVFESVESI